MFKASLDNLAKWLPIALVVFTTLLIISMSLTIDKNISFIGLIPVGILIGVTIGTYYYSPKGYVIEMDNISVIRKAGKFFISRKDIKEIKSIQVNDLGRTWRTMGNGGMFGYTGYYSSSKLSKMRWFVSQRKNYVLITMNNNSKFLLSPDDVDGFLKATQS